MGDKPTVWVYPTEEQLEQWERRADERDMSMSEFVQSMVEAGCKKFDADVDPDETERELRQQRNELRADLDRAQDRIRRLEERSINRERQELLEFVEKNPGATYNEAVQHIIDTVPERLNEIIEGMGDEIRVGGDQLYPADGGES